MWIEINNDVFEDSDFKDLNYIIQILSWFPKTTSRYNVFIDIDKVGKTENYKKLKGTDSNFEEYIEQQFNDFITFNPSNKARDYIITNKSTINSFKVEEAIRFFNQPISIILENNKNDAYFIKAIFSHIDNNSILNEYVENGWIKFENAGGCTNVKNFIEGELKSFEDLASRNNRNSYDYYKAFVVLDSDKEFINQPQKQQFNTLIQFLNSVGIDSRKHHVLRKRMMENYMPDEVLIELKNLYYGKQGKKDLFDWINVYLNLNDEQKDFLNMKSGFSKELDIDSFRKPLLNDILNLYNIPELGFQILDDGFKFPDFKNAFPEMFYSSIRVNKMTLLRRSNSNELNEILSKIHSLL